MSGRLGSMPTRTRAEQKRDDAIRSAAIHLYERSQRDCFTALLDPAEDKNKTTRRAGRLKRAREAWSKLPIEETEIWWLQAWKKYRPRSGDTGPRSSGVRVSGSKAEDAADEASHSSVAAPSKEPAADEPATPAGEPVAPAAMESAPATPTKRKADCGCSPQPPPLRARLEVAVGASASSGLLEASRASTRESMTQTTGSPATATVTREASTQTTATDMQPFGSQWSALFRSPLRDGLVRAIPEMRCVCGATGSAEAFAQGLRLLDLMEDTIIAWHVPLCVKVAVVAGVSVKMTHNVAAQSVRKLWVGLAGEGRLFKVRVWECKLVSHLAAQPGSEYVFRNSLLEKDPEDLW